MSDELAAIVEERSRRAVKAILDAQDRYGRAMDREDAQRLARIVKAEVGDVTRLASTLLSSLHAQLRDGHAMNQLWLERIAQELGVEVPETVETG